MAPQATFVLHGILFHIFLYTFFFLQIFNYLFFNKNHTKEHQLIPSRDGFFNNSFTTIIYYNNKNNLLIKKVIIFKFVWIFLSSKLFPFVLQNKIVYFNEKKQAALIFRFLFLKIKNYDTKGELSMELSEISWINKINLSLGDVKHRKATLEFLLK